MSTSDDREEAIRNAIRFLSDPKVKEAPLAKKITFLEGKGLTGTEIQSALQQVQGLVDSGTGSSLIPNQATTVPFQSQLSHQSYQHQPESGHWKETILKSVGMISVGASLVYAAKIYLGPFFDFPSAKSIQKDTELIQDQLKGTGKTLDQVTLSTMDLVKGLETHANNVGSSITEMSNLVNSLRKSDDQKTVELKLIKNEVDELKSTFPKLIEKTQENQTRMLDQIQAEIKSLKSLVMSRRKTEGMIESNSTSTTTIPSFTPASTSFAGVHFGSKPSIPAWQMAATKNVPEQQKMQQQNNNNNSSVTNSTTMLYVDDEVGLSATKMEPSEVVESSIDSIESNTTSSPGPINPTSIQEDSTVPVLCQVEEQETRVSEIPDDNNAKGGEKQGRRNQSVSPSRKGKGKSKSRT